MTITAEEARQLLGAQPQQQPHPAVQPQGRSGITAQEAQQLLQQMPQQSGVTAEALPPDYSHEHPPEHNILKSLGKGVLGAGVGTLQGLSDMGYGLAQLGDKGINFLTQKLFGKNFNLQAPKGDVYYGPAEKLRGTTGAKIGENVLAPALGVALGGEGLAGLGAPGAILPKMAAYGGISAATTPGSLGHRALAGGLGAIGGAAEHYLASLPYMFKGRLASKLEKLSAEHKGISKDLYDNAFRGTEKITPELSPETSNSLENLADAWATKSNPASRSINIFKKNPNLKNLHLLRSDLRGMQGKLTEKALKSGLDTPDINIANLLNNSVDNISNDLLSNMEKAGPEIHSKYLIAQNHYKNSVVPFRKYPSLRKLFSEDREVSPRLYTDLAKDAVGAKKLRELLKTSKGAMQLARIMHYKFMGLPLPAYLSLPGAYALYHKHNIGVH